MVLKSNELFDPMVGASSQDEKMYSYGDLTKRFLAKQCINVQEIIDRVMEEIWESRGPIGVATATEVLTPSVAKPNAPPSSTYRQ